MNDRELFGFEMYVNQRVLDKLIHQKWLRGRLHALKREYRKLLQNQQINPRAARYFPGEMEGAGSFKEGSNGAKNTGGG